MTDAGSCGKQTFCTLSVAAVLVPVLLAGCAVAESAADKDNDLVFLSKAQDAGPTAQKAMWQSTLSIKDAHRRALRLAILQSSPGLGYNPDAASRSLRALLADESNPSSAAIERLQLAQLDSHRRCQTEAQDLRQRAAKLVEIEQQIDAHREEGPLQATTNK